MIEFIHMSSEDLSVSADEFRRACGRFATGVTVATVLDAEGTPHGLTVSSFGKEKSGIVYGWIFATHQLGAAAAAYFAGLMRADLGSYLQAFMLSGALCFVAALMVMFIGVDWGRGSTRAQPA